MSRSLVSRLSSFVLLIERLDDMLNQLVTYDIALVELHKADALDALHGVHRAYQTAVALVWQVDLCNIARNDKLGVTAHTRKEHLNLR